MAVYVVADTVSKLSALRTLLEQQHAVTSELLGGGGIQWGGFDAVVIAANLRVFENISALKQMFAKLGDVRKRIFVIDQTSRLFTVQAYALGATRVLIDPVNGADVLAALADNTHFVAGSIQISPSARETAAGGAKTIASMFSAVLSGAPIDVERAKDAGSRIVDNVAEDGLSSWLDTVRRHHEGTYQHCLLVTGIAIDFGLSLGMARADIERLYSAAIFHDIGKAKIPLAVLDKPGRLDPEERALIETHPAAGYDVLKENPGISSEVLDAVRHHHEYLDGSGYPDALCAASISDVVRILTISDIFAALIEDRRYKPTLAREQAYEIVRGMRGKLEAPLVTAFREVALNR